MMRVERIPVVLRKIADFIEKEPVESFFSAPLDVAKSVPFTLKDDREKALKESLGPQFIDVYEVGKFGKNLNLNVLYMIGQALSTSYINLDAELSMMNEDRKPLMVEAIKKFMAEWTDEERRMNAGGVVRAYEHKSNEEIKSELPVKLKRSAELIEKDILPILE